MPYTGSDYANLPQTDMPTQIGMRLSMLAAVEEYKAQEASGVLAGKTDEQKAEIATRLIHDKVMENDILKAAGTAEVVDKYYQDIIATQPSKSNIVNFLDAIDADKVKGVKAALEQDDNQKLASAAGAFSSAFREHLGRESVTGSFKEYLETHKEELAAIEIKPRGFSQDQQELIDSYESKFRSADGWDDMLYNLLKNTPLLAMVQSLGIGFPAVNQHIAEFDPAIEQKMGALLDVSDDISKGTGPASAKLNAMQQILGSDVAVPADISTTQAQAIADKLENAIVRIRQGDPAAQSPDFLKNTFNSAVEESGQQRQGSLDENMTRALTQFQDPAYTPNEPSEGHGITTRVAQTVSVSAVRS